MVIIPSKQNPDNSNPNRVTEFKVAIEKSHQNFVAHDAYKTLGLTKLTQSPAN